MTEIINEPKIQNLLIVKFRELLNHHAFWLYLLTDEAEKEDLTPPGALASHYKVRYITGKRPGEKGRHQKSARAEKDAVYQWLQDGSLRWTRGHAVRLLCIF